MAGHFQDLDLSLGDAWEVSDDETETTNPADAKKKVSRGGTLPDVEGDAPLAESIAKYKKALLNKRNILKDVSKRLTDEGCTTHMCLDLNFGACVLKQMLPSVCNRGTEGRFESL